MCLTDYFYLALFLSSRRFSFHRQLQLKSFGEHFIKDQLPLYSISIRPESLSIGMYHISCPDMFKLAHHKAHTVGRGWLTLD